MTVNIYRGETLIKERAFFYNWEKASAYCKYVAPREYGTI